MHAMAVDERTNRPAKRRIDVTDLPAADVEEYASARLDGMDVRLERRAGWTYLIAEADR
jgi:hypothetical protein